MCKCFACLCWIIPYIPVEFDLYVMLTVWTRFFLAHIFRPHINASHGVSDVLLQASASDSKSQDSNHNRSSQEASSRSTIHLDTLSSNSDSDTDFFLA